MVLDCEYTQPNKKCIQIGAAVYDPRTAVCVETLETYVNPHEPISTFITELTGIRDRDVQGAPDIVEAWGMLKKIHSKHHCFKNPLVWGSGVRNDSLALHSEFSMASFIKSGAHPDHIVEENFMGMRVIDAKTLYVSLQLFNNGKYGGGLEESMERLGLKFEGTKHTALADARNTFTIWYYLTRKLHDGIAFK